MSSLGIPVTADLNTIIGFLPHVSCEPSVADGTRHDQLTPVNIVNIADGSQIQQSDDARSRSTSSGIGTTHTTYSPTQCAVSVHSFKERDIAPE